MRLFLLAVLAAVLAGCAAGPPRAMYLGAPLPVERIAVIVIPPPEPPGLFSALPVGWVEVRAVDGQPVPVDEGRPLELHVLPGQRRLTMRYVYSAGGGGLIGALLEAALVEDMTKRFERDIEFEASTGGRYIVKHAVKSGGLLTPVWNWRVAYWIEDAFSGKTVADSGP